MFNVISDISWFGLLASIVAVTVLGGLYFVLVIPAQYTRVMGREGQSAAEQGLLQGLGPVLCNVLIAATSALLIAALGVESVSDALVFGLIVGVGYLAAMTLQIAINRNFPHPIRYTALNAPFFVVSSLVTSVLLVVV